MILIIRLIARPVLAVYIFYLLSTDPRTHLTKEQYIFGTGISMVELCLLHLIIEIHFLFCGFYGITITFVEEARTPIRIVEESIWIVIFIVATILFYRKHIRKWDPKENWEDILAYGWIFMSIFLVLSLFCIFLYYWTKKIDDADFFIIDLVILFALSSFVNLILILKSKKELRRIAETKKNVNRRGKRKRRSRNREISEKT